MAKITDNICKLRDIFQDKKNFKKVLFYQRTMTNVFEEMHRRVRNKAINYDYELEFTAQDLRELASDIRNFLKYLEGKMSPEKNIKKISELAKIENNKKRLDLNAFMFNVIPIMEFRRDCVQKIYELLNLVEYDAVYLYFLELASNDSIALKCTERLLKDEKYIEND